MAFTRSGVRFPSPPLCDKLLQQQHLRVLTRQTGGNSSVGRAQPCQGWGRGFESRFPLSDGGKTGRAEGRKDGIPLSIVYAEKLLLSKPYDH